MFSEIEQYVPWKGGKGMKTRSLPKLLTILVLLVVVGLTSCAPAALTAVSPAVVTATPTPLTPTVVPTTAPAQTLTKTSPVVAVLTQEQLLADLYERVNPSVVNINIAEATGEGAGSGFVYDTLGHIVTNNHVVENATQIWVTFADGTTVSAKVVGTDPGSDLAVIQVDVAAEKLHPVTLGDSDSLRVGQLAVAIGNPFGLESTMTSGIISALGRVIPSSSSSFSIVDLIQTDAPINPGNSGGPLLDSAGRVIGVNTMIYTESGTSSGVGLALPVVTVKQVVPSLISTGHYAHAWLGLSGLSITPILAESLNLPVQQGALVESVTSGGPAQRAGIRGGSQPARTNSVVLNAGGDIIIAVDDIEVKSFDDLVSYLARKTEVGQQVVLTILRDGQRLSVKVTLAERPASV